MTASGGNAFPEGGPPGGLSFLEDESRGAFDQMEVDAALMGREGNGWEGLLRIYRFRGTCVTVGRTFQGDLPLSWLDLGPEVAVRPTGGGAVLHREDLCLSLYLFPRPAIHPKQFYSLFHGWLNRFLETLSVRASCIGQGIPAGRQMPHGVCFEQPVPGDLVSEGRKVLGGALRVSGRTLLYQGSLSVPGYGGDDLKKAFVKWYPGKGELLLDLLLSSSSGAGTSFLGKGSETCPG
ncbi:MAG: lipoyl protein ligase domain-containing protein [Leptospirales bacterium]